MDPKSQKLLKDIKDACDRILSSTSSKTFKEFDEDHILRAAVERWLEIIGEAINRLQRIDPVTAERAGDVPLIIGFRNYLAHGYDTIKANSVWQVVKDDVPRLFKRVKDLL
jgi:uncharacterized protein with HEPN domain